MLNLVVNILFGYILETLFFGYAFNKIKNIHHKGTYIIYLISYILAAIIIQFTFQNIYYGYIIAVFVFEIINSIVYKNKFNITNVFLLLNLILISSTFTTIPILIFGYNTISLVVNRLEIILFILLVKMMPLEKYYKLIISNWNKTTNNKIKSVTIRNFTLIIIFLLITIINIFLNNYFLSIYQNIL